MQKSSSYFKFANYYTQRQYSKYIRPGYTRIGLTCSGCATTTVGLNVKGVAFRSPSGAHIAVVLNDRTTVGTLNLAGFPAGTYQVTGVDPANLAGRTYPDQTIATGQALTLTIPAQGIVTFAQRAAALRGDLDGNGKVDLDDLRRMIYMLIGQIPKDLTTADLDGDGALLLVDLQTLVRILVGIP